MEIPRIPIPPNLFTAPQLKSAVIQSIAENSKTSFHLLPISRQKNLQLHVLHYTPKIIVSDKFFFLEAQFTEDAIVSFKRAHPDIEIKKLKTNFIEILEYEIAFSHKDPMLIIKKFDILSFESSTQFGAPTNVCNDPNVKNGLSRLAMINTRNGISNTDKSVAMIDMAIRKGNPPSIVIHTTKVESKPVPVTASFQLIEEIEKRNFSSVPMEAEEIHPPTKNLNLGEYISNLQISQLSEDKMSCSQSILKKSIRVQSSKDSQNNIQNAITQLMENNNSEEKSLLVLSHLAEVSASGISVGDKKKEAKNVKILKGDEGDSSLIANREQLKRFREWKEFKEYDNDLNRNIDDLLKDNGKMQYCLEEEIETRRKKYE